VGRLLKSRMSTRLLKFSTVSDGRPFRESILSDVPKGKVTVPCVNSTYDALPLVLPFTLYSVWTTAPELDIVIQTGPVGVRAKQSSLSHGFQRYCPMKARNSFIGKSTNALLKSSRKRIEYCTSC
jgi:hypothetical protein